MSRTAPECPILEAARLQAEAASLSARSTERPKGPLVHQVRDDGRSESCVQRALRAHATVKVHPCCL